MENPVLKEQVAWKFCLLAHNPTPAFDLLILRLHKQVLGFVTGCLGFLEA
jgi:hypothetical protein